MNKKIAQPVNPLIYRTAAEFATVFYEAGRSSGMTSKYPSAKHYAAAYLERFIPMAVKTLIDMLKPTSNCTEHMRQEIHAALTDPLNDPDLMTGKKNGIADFNAELMAKAMKAFDKNKIETPVNSNVPPVLAVPKKSKSTVKSKLLNTANPLASGD